MSSPHHPDSSATHPPADGSFPLTNRYPELRDVAVPQLGVVSYRQLRDRGWSRHRVGSEIALGRWTQVAPRVIAMQNAPLVRAQLLWLGVLHAGSPAVLSHATACELAGLRWTIDPTIHVMTARGDLVGALPGFRFHQTRRRYAGWADRTTAPPRLTPQHAALLTAERDHHLRRAIGLLAASVQQGLCTPDQLLLGIDQIRKLRHGELFRLALGDIAAGAQSFAEIDVGRLCREAGLRQPDRQRIRHDKEGRRRYLDCEWWLAAGAVVVLEIDGSFHMRTEAWWADMRRERAVVLSGRRVLRCSSIEIRLGAADIVEDLVAAGIPRLVSDDAA